MFKLVLFKFILFLLYLLAALVAKFKGSSSNVRQNSNDQIITNYKPNIDESGMPTNWINPFITRYTTTTTTVKSTTTTIFLRTRATTKSKFLKAIKDDDD